MTVSGSPDARAAAGRAARDAYGRTLALLAYWGGELASAEDALADALMLALERWPSIGVPDNPQAWLLTVARRRRIDRARRDARGEHAIDLLARLPTGDHGEEASSFPDRRLALMLACAHPAIDPAARTPLILQTILGLTAAQIASAYLVSPAAMTKRLVRAKAKLHATGVRFVLPETDELPARMQPVLDAIYAAFTLDHGERPDAAGSPDGLTSEAIWLGRVVVSLVPDLAEPVGLLALMLFVDSRRSARRDGNGAFVRLSRQDPLAWDAAAIDEAETLLRSAGRVGMPGRFQIEAAIQAVHADRRRTGATGWPTIVTLYDQLLTVSPVLGAQIARCGAIGEAQGATAGLAELEAIDVHRVITYQPYWATRAHLLAGAGRSDEARTAFVRAAGLTDDAAVRDHLLARGSGLAS